MCIHAHTYSLSMVCLKIGYLRINITLSHLITLKSLLDPGRKASLQKQLFYYFHHWWPASVARNIWHIVLQGMNILPQKFSLSLIATIIKILLPDTAGGRPFNSFEFILLPANTNNPNLPKARSLYLLRKYRGRGCSGAIACRPQGPAPRCHKGKEHG